LPDGLEVAEADRDDALAAIRGGESKGSVVTFFRAGKSPHARGGLEAKGGRGL
jgi:hypothetical protein